MRVLYFSDNGSDHNRRFLEKISSFGHEVWFLDFTGGAPEFALPPRVTRVVPEKTFPRFSAPDVMEAFLPELKFWIAELRPEILHAGPVQTCGYLAALSGFHPLIVMSWGSDLLLHAEKSAVWQQATGRALRAADGFACDCEAVRSAAFRYANWPSSLIAQFPWGMERGAFTPDGEKAAGYFSTLGAITCLCTRGWEPLYDVDVLLEAFALAYERNQNLRLLLLGDGSLREQILRSIEERKLERVVTTCGEAPPSEMPKWFRAADVYVSCAKSDGTSISLLEAMSTGLPVVVSDIPSNREWVTEGENGWLAAVGSSREFAGKMIRAANLTAGQRQAIARRNQEIVSQRADWDRNFPRLMKLYDTVVEARGPDCVTRMGKSS